MKGIYVFLLLSLFLVGSNALRKRNTAGAPTLENVEVTDVDVSAPNNANVTMAASDPNGVKYIHVYYGDDTGILAEASWNATSTSTDVSVIVKLTVYRLVPGVYPLTVTVCDMTNNCDTYGTDDLDAANLQDVGTIFSNMVNISCPHQPYSVLAGEADVQCTFTVTSNPLPVVSYNIFATLYHPNGDVLTTIYPDNGSFDDPTATATTVNLIATFKLAQYSANGTYTVMAEASGSNYMYRITSDSFTVKPEINDLYPPALKAISAANIVLPNTGSINVQVQATDDAVGLASITINIYGFGSGNWTNNNNVIASNTSVSLAIPITPMNSTLVKRLYYISMRLCDKIGKCDDWTSSDLASAGYQSTFNVGPVDPNASKGTITCGGPYDVANGPVTVTCNYAVTFVTGIYTYTVFVSRAAGAGDTADTPTVNMQATPGYFDDPTGNTITQTSTQKITLPQYSPYGTYVVVAKAYNDDLTVSQVATVNFTVSKTTNDMGPPTLRALYVGVPANINSFQARVSASDDASGVAAIQVYLFSKGTTGVGLDNTTTTKNNRMITNAQFPIVMNVYNASQSIFFVVEVMLTDVLGNKKYYSTLDLGSQGFQANVTLLPYATTSTGSISGTTGNSGGGTTTDAGFSLSVSLHNTLFAFVFLLLLHFVTK